MDENSYDYQQYMIKLQESNVLSGITNEPRVFYDTIQTGIPLAEVQGHPEVFRNGEDFPIRITHCLMALKRLRFDAEEEENVPVDPRNIQRMGVRLKFHDQYYMNRYASNPIAGTQRQVFVPAPAWALNPTAAAEIISFGSSAWQFQRPFILSVRDTIRVDLQLDEAPTVEEVSFPVTVSFTGKGVLSSRPYFFSGMLFIGDAQRQTLDTENFKNDGSEPVMITNMTVNVSGASSDADSTGDISRVSVGIRQIGNGTNAAWVSGPVNEPGLVPDMVPAVLLGQQSGRAIVHRFPGHGLLWAPGEGITAQVQNLTGGAILGASVHIGLLGYISVQ
jgi:hypothetical protein